MSVVKMASEQYVDSKVGEKYTKPDGGIPASDMASAVQTSLGKADTALQQHQDISGKADKNEMSVTPGTGADADKTTIQLKDGTSATVLVSHQSLAAYVNGGSYDSDAKKILLKHDSTTIAEIDATAFIKDGMVSSVEIEDGKLIITFNTDAGLEPIEIPLTDIFNPSNYYDKTAADGKFVAKETGKGLSTNDYTTAEKEKLAGAKIENGTIFLGAASITPLTAHQDISGKADVSALRYALAVPPDGTQAKTLQLADRAVNVVTAAKINAHDAGWTWYGESGSPIEFSGTAPVPFFDSEERYTWAVSSQQFDDFATALFGKSSSYFDNFVVYSYENDDTANPVEFYIDIAREMNVVLKEVHADDTAVYTVNGVDVGGYLYRFGENPDDGVYIELEYDGFTYRSGDYTVGDAVPNTTLSVSFFEMPTVQCEYQSAGQDYDTLLYPAPTVGRVRDFAVTLDLGSGTPPTLSFAAASGSAVQVVSADGNFPEIQPGLNILYFTEVEQGMLMVKAETMEAVSEGGAS